MKNLVWTAIATGTLLVTTTACEAKTAVSEPQLSPDTTTELSPQPPETAQAAAANLLTYDETASGMPVSAQYPETMQVEGGCSGEGCGFSFRFVPQGNGLDEAEVHVFLPAGVATAADQEVFVTGPNGLIANSGWIVDSLDTDGSTQFPYPWVEKVINFSTDKEQSGHILLGQTDGQAVQVLLLYPAEMADAYWPAAKTVLDSLAFDADLLPLSRSSEGE